MSRHLLKIAEIAVCLFVTIVWMPSAPAQEKQPKPIGTVVFQENFDRPDTLADWQGAGDPKIQLEDGPDGGKVVSVRRDVAEGAGSRGGRIAIDPDDIRGAKLLIEARVKAQDVAVPPNSWNGIKVMLYTLSPAGKRWDQQNSLWGSFDWKPIRFQVAVPDDISEAILTLGLEQTTGRVWFDDVRIKIIGRRRARPEHPAGKPSMDGRIRYRGAMVGSNVSEADLEVLCGQWKANHIRRQLIWGGFPHGPADTATVEEYNAWLESALEHTDRLVPVCRRLGARIVLDVHTPPGGRLEDKNFRMFQEKEFQDAFVAAWERMARRYRDNDVIWGYDLVNEPCEGIVADGLMDWRQLAEHTARRIRQIDPHHPIIVEPAPWGSPDGLDWFEPLPMDNIIYSVHMYIPHQFTHQGVYNSPTGILYPGKIGGVDYDRERLREALRPVIEFQEDYGVPMYLGEFSAIRWAPDDSAYRYLRDVIDIFEQEQWHWAYHAFREWDGWSVEHGPDRNDHRPTAQPTDRQLLLRKWYEKNERG